MNTIKTDYEKGVIDKDQAKERLTYVKKDVQEDNQRFEEVKIETKVNPKTTATDDLQTEKAVNAASLKHQSVEKEINDLLGALDA